MRTVHAQKLAASAVLVATAWVSPARAITVETDTKGASLVGSSFAFKAVVAEASGAVQYRWSFGDDIKTEFEVGKSEVAHLYDKPGHYTVAVTVKDETGAFSGATWTHVAHQPLTTRRPTASTSIVYDAARNRIYSVNQDNDSVSAIDPVALSKTNELPVYRKPEALALTPRGKLWVLHQEDYAIAVVDPDTFTVERGFRLPYASQPVGLCVSPTGDAAYVTLLALGKLLKLDPESGQVLAEVAVGPSPRGVSVTGDGSKVYVTRFVSSTTGGEVVEVDAASLQVSKRITLAPDTTTPDSDQSGRGLPNFLFAVGLSPDGREAWIPGKKDNIFRGSLRDDKALTQDNTVRPLVSVLDLAQGAEVLGQRMDLDDRNLPTYVEFSPFGDYAFVTVTGSNLVEVRDAFDKSFKTALTEAGLAPR